MIILIVKITNFTKSSKLFSQEFTLFLKLNYVKIPEFFQPKQLFYQTDHVV